MEIHIDDDACVRSGACVSLAPGRFAIDGDRTVVSAPEMAHDAADAAAVADAASCCPGAAIAMLGAPAHPVRAS